MKIQIILMSIALFLTSPLWSAAQESPPESEWVIGARPLSGPPLEELKMRQEIAENLSRFFVPFDERATNLVVLNNLSEAMNGGMSTHVEIWENYLTESSILTQEQIPLFRTIYGNVLSVFRQEGPPYFNSRSYSRSSCFLTLLFGELGQKNFPSSYLKPLVFGEWLIYQQNQVPPFVYDFVRCLNEINQQMTLATSPTKKDCENWHSLPIEDLEHRKRDLGFSDFLKKLKTFEFQSLASGLKKTSALCTYFRVSLEEFHEAGLPLVREIDRIINNRRSQKRSLPSQIGPPDLLNWSLAGSKFANYILLTGKEGNHPSLILKSLETTLVEDAGVTPRFTISKEKSIMCDERMRVDISKASIKVFLGDIWPTLHPFFTKGELVPFTVYGAQHHSQLQISFDDLEKRIEHLQHTARAEKETQEKAFKAALAEVTRKLLSEEAKTRQRAQNFAEQKVRIKAAESASKNLSGQLQKANRDLTEAQERLQALLAADKTQQLEEEIFALKKSRQEKDEIISKHQQEMSMTKAQFQKEMEVLKKDLESRLQEATDQCGELRKQLELLSREKPPHLPPTEVLALPKETTPLSPPSAARNDDTPSLLKKTTPLPAQHPPSTHPLSRSARAFIPSTHYAFSTVMTPNGIRWMPVPPYPYPPF
jgi:hypothetical protein